MLGEVWGLAVNAGAMALFQRDLKRCVQTFRDRRGIKMVFISAGPTNKFKIRLGFTIFYIITL
ncbi:hypothetical protein CO218_09010 [Lactiplantibacillus plantarum]|uniref:Uncharacterized protein n=1 Tax=Lactiplantibacillus plantarum 2025 TaxID=1385856 RepID=A0A837NQC1_LACPN|nr:hypothetical protein AN634_09690 [Lactiplantibacillus plantarum]AVE84110.1 hypothetical protein C4O30_14350 [Lactiplantibacillus plantarum]AVW03702.1 hypothetical protein DA078_02240 [Lactiplantibacillus plantarum]AYE59252.1 hypothetical protein CO218_09010 [Lactiplantibacillus plantarum]MCT3213087.1 hypothetical protein [Lactiplantibacillus plantarum]